MLSLSFRLFSLLLLVTPLILALAGVSAQSAEIAAPESTVLLRVTGDIAHSNTDEGSGVAAVELDLAMLEELGGQTITTTTPWTEGDTEFEGVLLSRLLAFVGARSDRLVLTAVDGYSAELRAADFADYPLVIAYKRDGNYMDIRQLGPLWLMFPFDQYPQLNNESNKSAAVWQLIDLVVR